MRAPRPLPPDARPPDAQAWMRHVKVGWASAHAHLSALSIPRSTPSMSSPTLAMPAFEGLMRGAQRHGPWMALDVPQDPRALHAHVQERACAGFPRSAVVAGIRGWTTGTIVWILADMSAILTRLEGKHLLIYPGVIQVQHMSLPWRVAVLVGKSIGGTKLCFYPPKKDRFLYEGHGCLEAGRVFGREEPPRLFQDDVDLLDGLFEGFEGTAWWPDGRSLPVDNRWPTFLPHAGVPDPVAQAAEDVIEQGAAWISTLLVQYGRAPTGITLGRHHGALYFHQHLHAKGSITLIPGAAIPELFPSGIRDALVAHLSHPEGVRYVAARGKSYQPKAWRPLTGSSAPLESVHARMAFYGRWGVPSARNLDTLRGLVG